jgi:hypothetical protein
MAAATVASRRTLHRNAAIKDTHRSISEVASTIALPEKKERMGEYTLEMLMLNG